jgi:hypothetical protein
MQRSNMTIIDTFIRKTTRPTLANVKRGKIYCDFAELSGKADGTRVGTIFGLDVRRKASLNDGEIQYYDDNNNLIAQNF